MLPIARELVIWNGHRLYESHGGTPYHSGLTEEGLGYPQRENLIDQIGDPYINVYRRTVAKEREYILHLNLTGRDGAHLARLQNDWEVWHATTLGQKVLKRVTANGHVYCLDCVAGNPEWEGEGRMLQVSQPYQAADPWWRSESEQSASGNFNAATPVNIACANAGDMPTWIRAVIVGPVNKPRLTIGSYYVEVNLNVGAGEGLEIVCRPPAEINYSVGSVTTATFGYRTNGSWFNRVMLPASATTNAVLTATSGNGACTLYWYNLYGALR